MRISSLGLFMVSTTVTSTLIVACGSSTRTSPPNALPAPQRTGQVAMLGGGPTPVSALSNSGNGAFNVVPDPNAALDVGTLANFDPREELKDMGKWVRIGEEEYFQPLTETDEPYVPYQDGQWAYDSSADGGMTWTDYAPFGEITSHYGAWRHSPRFGWVWRQLPTLKYHPALVSWFDQGEYIGWVPMVNEPRLYAIGTGLFDDGFELGLRTPNFDGDFRFRIGLTVVLRKEVTLEKIAVHRIIEPRVLVAAFTNVHLSAFPGGTRKGAFQFIVGHGAPPPATGTPTRFQTANGHELRRLITDRNAQIAALRTERRTRFFGEARPEVAAAPAEKLSTPVKPDAALSARKIVAPSATNVVESKPAPLPVVKPETLKIVPAAPKALAKPPVKKLITVKTTVTPKHVTHGESTHDSKTGTMVTSGRDQQTRTVEKSTPPSPAGHAEKPPEKSEAVTKTLKTPVSKPRGSRLTSTPAAPSAPAASPAPAELPAAPKRTDVKN